MKDECNCFIIIFYLLIATSSVLIYPLGTMIQGYYFNYYSLYISNNFYQVIDCDLYSDMANEYTEPEIYNFLIKVSKRCKRHKAMLGLEYSTFIINLVLSIFNILLMVKTECTLIVLILSFISFPITITYVSFNGYIFSNDCPLMIYPQTIYFLNNYNQEFSLFNVVHNNLLKTDSKGAVAKLDSYTERYVLLFPNKDDSDLCGPFLKYKDLVNKFINYHKELYSFYNEDNNNEYRSCQIKDWDINLISEGLLDIKTFTDNEGYTKICKYLYHYEPNSGIIYRNI